MWTIVDIHDYIIRDCLFCCPYDLGMICTCISPICNLSYDISLEIIEDNYYLSPF